MEIPMKTWHEEIPYDFTDPVIDRTFTEDALFFDIETTGFSPARTSLYLIGCAVRRENTLILDQFFAESPDQEADVLGAFLPLLARYGTVITFNGIGFDIPYLKAKCENLNIPDPFLRPALFDIYKAASRIRFLLKLPNLKQKSIETFLGTLREDAYDGGELIRVYQDYVSSPSEEALFLLRQHNFCDVLDMPGLLKILAYQDLLDGNFKIESVKGNEYTAYDGTAGNKELLFTLSLNTPLPQRVSCGYEEFYLTAKGAEAHLRVRLFEGDLKFFFDNYRDYYYLPGEDTAIHKSIAASVDKDHRKSATASTCYTWKYAIFLPQYDAVMNPLFRQDYRDKKSYFELTGDFAESDVMKRRYVMHILSVLARKKR